MTPEQIARVYIAAIELEERLGTESSALADEAGTLRGELHTLFMDSLREASIDFADRADATRIAYQLNG